MVAIINGTEYPVDEGAVLTDNLSETLDSSTIRISHLRTKLDIQPYDKVILVTKVGYRYMEIDDYVETMTCLSPKIYQYEISLFSQTKELEGIILPNLSITQRRTGQKLKVSDYLERYLELYGKKYRASDETFKDRWSFGDILRFNDIESPEMQWNTPTLRDVLNSLMMVDDCIPVLRDNVIEALDLSKKYGDITRYGLSKYINYIRRSQSSADYASEIKMTMKNVLQTNVEGTVNSSRTSSLPFVAREGYLITSENFTFKTKYPINKIQHFYFGFWCKCVEGGQTRWLYLEQDLCNIKGKYDSVFSNLVIEKKEFDTKDIAYKLSDVDTDYFSNVVNFQNFCFYFTRGSREIGNLNTTSKTWFVFEETTFQSIINMIADLCLPRDSIESVVAYTSDQNYYRPIISIVYETLAEQTFSAGKREPVRNSRTIVDNQTNSWVDAYVQGKLEYQKINRIGNKQLLINARYTDDFDRIIRIGDYYIDEDGDTNIIYQVQYQLYENHVGVNAIACKDYVLRDYFTGVKSKTRTWVNARDEAFERSELIKYYVEFSKNSKRDFIFYELGISPNLFIKCLTETSNSPVSYSNIKFTIGETNSYGGHICDLVSRIIGDSIVFTLGMDDNSIQYFDNGLYYDNVLSAFEKQLGGIPEVVHISNDYVEDYNGIPSKPVSYVDNNLETKYVSFIITSEDSMDFKPNNGASLTAANEATLNSYLVSQFSIRDHAHSVSSPNGFTPVVVKNYLLYKDNREIPTFNLQFEFCSDTRDITFTKKFIERQTLVRTKTITGCKIYQGEKSRYDHITPTLYGASEVLGASITINDIYDESSNIIINGVTRDMAYYIVDEDGEILIASLTSAFFLNVVKDRDPNIYNEDGEVVGTIIQ